MIKELKKNKPLFLMALPAVLFFLVFNYAPMFGLILAFKNFNIKGGILFSPWSGLKNFEFLFSTTDAFVITRNTLFYNLAFIIVGTVIAVSLAVVLCELSNKYLVKIYQTVIIMPYFLSWVVVGFMVFSLLNPDKGYVNNILVMLHHDPIMWYSEPKYWPLILIMVNIWKNAGYSSIVYMATIVGISKEYYEAAVIDGANKWQQIIRITLPSIIPMVIIMTLLAMGRIFNADFGLFYQVPRDSGLLYSVTDVIDLYVYNGLRVTGNIGMAAAANFYQSIIGFLLVMFSNFAVGRIDKDYKMF